MADKRVPIVFLDTNIFKFSSLVGVRSSLVESKVPWGDIEVTANLRVREEYHKFDKMKADHQKWDSISLPFLAFDGLNDRLHFITHPEVRIELMGLKGIRGKFGWFYGCEVETKTPESYDYSRTWLGGGKSKQDHLQNFIKSIKSKRYQRLCRLLGGFQGHDRPFHTGQALDAFHLWMAEELKADYFLTMDKNLIDHMVDRKVDTPVTVLRPATLLRNHVRQKGFLHGSIFLLKGYKFAKQRFS